MHESDNRWNRWFRRIKTSHRMTRLDVVECCRTGGLTVSASTADAWARSAGGPKRRAQAMTETEFDAFTAGLTDWARSAYGADD